MAIEVPRRYRPAKVGQGRQGRQGRQLFRDHPPGALSPAAARSLHHVLLFSYRRVLRWFTLHIPPASGRAGRRRTGSPNSKAI